MGEWIGQTPAISSSRSHSSLTLAKEAKPSHPLLYSLSFPCLPLPHPCSISETEMGIVTAKKAEASTSHPCSQSLQHRRPQEPV